MKFVTHQSPCTVQRSPLREVRWGRVGLTSFSSELFGPVLISAPSRPAGLGSIPSFESEVCMDFVLCWHLRAVLKVSGGRAGLMDEYSKPFHRERLVTSMVGVSFLLLLQVTTAALFHFIAADKTSNKNSQLCHVCMVALKMIYMPEEASRAFLVNYFWFFPQKKNPKINSKIHSIPKSIQKFSLFLFTANFSNRMVRTSEFFHICVVTIISCTSST